MYKFVTFFISLVLAIFWFLNPSFISAQTIPGNIPNQNLYTTNGAVQTALVSTDGLTVFVGGSFSQIGPSTGHGVALSTVTGSWDSSMPKVNGSVKAVVSDGSNGWYIGGIFSNVDGKTRNNIAHILSDKTVDSLWNPNVNGTVQALALSGTNLYVGGSFPSLGVGSSLVNRNNLAAITTSGVVTSWDPSVFGIVYSLAQSGNTLYIGGNFGSVGAGANNKTRRRLAAIDTTTGIANNWDPNGGGGNVYTLAIGNSTIYAGGDFTTMGVGVTVTRNRLAAFNNTTGATTSWDPNANNTITAITLSSSNNPLYVGGVFTTLGVGGSLVTRNRIAAIDTTSGNATSWDPNANSNINALVLSGNTLYTGGSFTTLGVGGSLVTRRRIAAIDTTSGNATNWDPNLDNAVRALALSGNTLYAGGDFTSIGSGGSLLTRNRLAAIDTTTGIANSWNPGADNSIFTLALSNSTVYTGGNFTTIGGESRSYFAGFDFPTPTPTQPPTQTDTNQTAASSTSSGGCNGAKPYNTPDLFQINVTNNTAKLFFTPSSTNDYFVSFSEKPNAEDYGSQVTLMREGVQSYTVYLLKPNTTYYFKVRGQNGCMPGDWSNTMVIKTNTKNVTRVSIFYKNTSVVQKVVSSFIAKKGVKVTPVLPTTKTVTPMVTQTPTVISQPELDFISPVPTNETPGVVKKKCFLCWCW